MINLCVDFGHGGTDSEATYKGRKESDDVISIGEISGTNRKDCPVALRNKLGYNILIRDMQ